MSGGARTLWTGQRKGGTAHLSGCLGVLGVALGNHGKSRSFHHGGFLGCSVSLGILKPGSDTDPPALLSFGTRGVADLDCLSPNCYSALLHMGRLSDTILTMSTGSLVLL